MKCLQRGWRQALSDHVRSAARDLLIASPYVTQEGTALVEASLSREFRQSGRITLITDLSPLNVIQGSTDPSALQFLANRFANCAIWHLPRLHAKVYVADAASAIISSGNLTKGGLDLNYEYGVEIDDPAIVGLIRRDVAAYGSLGARIDPPDLRRYRDTADTVRAAFRRQQQSVTSSARMEFERLFRTAEDELISLRISGASRTAVFQKTIEYLLDRYGPLTTPEIHARVQMIHPDLCDETVDRVINGKHFGKQWKHAVRTAQSHLKDAGQITLDGGRWQLADQPVRP
jgi:phosphatidylserine/phosphatidylglycerophosphate/cardiolipin synthase-like enzyme